MKYLCMLLLAIAALCSNVPFLSAKTTFVAATTTTTSSNRSLRASTNTQQNLRQTQAVDPNYTPWSNGTPVYWQFPGEGWWKGEITHFSYDNAEYTIEWEDGSKDYNGDFEEVDQMVAYAQNDPNTAVEAPTEFPTEEDTAEAPTEAPTEFPTEEETAEAPNEFLTEEENADITMVPFDNATPELWQAGTPVASYEDNKWWFGQIEGFNGEAYFIRWDDKEVEVEDDLDLVNQMVTDAEAQIALNKPKDVSSSKYPVGTPVYDISDEDGSVWTGVVESYYKGDYGIRWSNGSVDTYVEGPKMDEMVAAALSSSSRNSSAGMKPAGKALVSILCLLLIAAGAFVGMAFYKKKQLRASIEQNKSLEEPREDNIVSYRDEPADNTPKII